MWNMVWPILMVLVANTFYNICAKSMPSNANPFLSLSVTYLTAAATCVGAYLLWPGRSSLSLEFSRLNWVSVVFGLCLVGLEFGYINVYRAGWKVSTASLTANILLAIILIFVGIFLYKEGISPKQIAGVVLCMAGLVLISR